MAGNLRNLLQSPGSFFWCCNASICCSCWSRNERVREVIRAVSIIKENKDSAKLLKHSLEMCVGNVEHSVKYTSIFA